MTLLIDAGIRAVATEGLDQVSVQSVSTSANTSRPTFYSYFGDINGLLAEIWLAKSDEWLAMLCNPALSIGSLKGEAKVLNSAMSEIFAAAHRIPEVNELVQPSMKKWWDKEKTKPLMVQLKVLWLMAERLGVTITEPVDQDVHKAAFIEAFLNLIPDDMAEKLNIPEQKQLPPVSEPEIVNEDLESRLLQSAVEVIATGGVKSASMARVARKTQVSTGAIYPRYSKVEEIIESSFEAAITQVVRQNFSLLNAPSFSTDDFGLFVMAGLTENRKIWRNFRIEIHLGAKTRPSLAKRMKKNLKETNVAVADRLSAYQVPEIIEEPIPYLIHCVGIGFAILQNSGVPVAQIDHRAISRAMVAGILGSGLGESNKSVKL